MTLMESAAAARKLLPRRPEGDFYATPARCTEALLKADPPPAGPVWEPACGDGAIAKVLDGAGYPMMATDLHDRGYGEPGCDFLKEPALRACAIITNPPFNLADEFALRALSMEPEYLAIFQRLAWLEGAKRHAKLWGPHPPSRIWIFSSRQTLWRGDDPAGKSTGGTIAFAWFVWDRRAAAGPPVIGWLHTTRSEALAYALDLL